MNKSLKLQEIVLRESYKLDKKSILKKVKTKREKHNIWIIENYSKFIYVREHLHVNSIILLSKLHISDQIIFAVNCKAVIMISITF